MATAKQNKLIVNLVTKWANAAAGTNTPDMDKVRKLVDRLYTSQVVSGRVTKIKKVKENGKLVKKKIRQWQSTRMPPPAFIFVQSPMAFMMAQAVMRGRYSKNSAKQVCAAFGIDPGFLEPLRRDSLCTIFTRQRNWYSETSKLLDAWESTLKSDLKGAALTAFFDENNTNNLDVFRRTRLVASGPRRGRATPAARLSAAIDRFQSRLSDLPPRLNNTLLYQLANNDFLRVCEKQRQWQRLRDTTDFGNFSCSAADGGQEQNALADVPWTSSCASAMFSRWGELDPESSWKTSMLDGELLCELIGAKSNQFRDLHELLYELPLFMTFKHHVLICPDRPVIKRNADGELHCEDGPAVRWPDGAAQYYVDGHALGALGHKIIETPERLTLTDINQEANEEIKRVAISRYGWSKYLDEIGARVLDRRENWVDNTVEALVQINTRIQRRGWRGVMEENTVTQHKMILACRSTGRQYFLAVPAEINSCADAQRWMADGAFSTSVKSLNLTPRIVGAS